MTHLCTLPDPRALDGWRDSEAHRRYGQGTDITVSYAPSGGKADNTPVTFLTVGGVSAAVERASTEPWTLTLNASDLAHALGAVGTAPLDWHADGERLTLVSAGKRLTLSGHAPPKQDGGVGDIYSKPAKPRGTREGLNYNSIHTPHSESPVETVQQVRAVLRKSGRRYGLALYRFEPRALVVTVENEDHRIDADLLSAPEWFALLAEANGVR